MGNERGNRKDAVKNAVAANARAEPGTAMPGGWLGFSPWATAVSWAAVSIAFSLAVWVPAVAGDAEPHPAGDRPGAEQPPPEAVRESADDLLTTEGDREEDRLRFFKRGNTVFIEVVDAAGIGKAAIQRKTQHWPASIRVHLHLSGLESFKAGCGDVRVEWGVSSGGDNRSWVALWRDNTEREIDRKSPYFTEARIVGGNRTIPLKGGYFEVPLPAVLFEGNPKELTLQWIDFYRR